MGVDSAIKTIDGMADLGAGAGEATAGVSVFSSKPKGKDGAKIEEAIQWERAQTCC